MRTVLESIPGEFRPVVTSLLAERDPALLSAFLTRWPSEGLIAD